LKTRRRGGQRANMMILQIDHPIHSSHSSFSHGPTLAPHSLAQFSTIQSNPVLQKGVCKPMPSQIYTCRLHHATDSQKRFTLIDQSYQSIVRRSTSIPKATRRTALIFRNKKIYKRHGCAISRRRKNAIHHACFATLLGRFFRACCALNLSIKTYCAEKVTIMYD
jgi:hypothetical protein